MFEQLFGSKTRVKLMNIFLDNPDKKFYVRELTRMADSLINSVRRELTNLEELKFILVEETDKPDVSAGEAGAKKSLNSKKYYYLNPKNIFQSDLLNLFSKGKILVERKFLERIKRLGDVRYISLGGIFAEDDRATTDVLIVGAIDREKVGLEMAEFERETSRVIRYTVMDLVEYQLRKDISDRFLLDILENPKNFVVHNNFEQKQNETDINTN